MIVDELFLNCSIKPFHMGIHLGGSGIGMPVVFMQSSYLLIEVLAAADIGFDATSKAFLIRSRSEAILYWIYF